MTLLTGVDVSAWQAPPHTSAPIDWTRARAAGVSFAALKATEGTGFVDPSYASGMASARAAGIGCLFAYHFLWPGEGAAQADHYVATVGDLSDLGVMLDCEKNSSGTWPAFADIDAFIARLIDHHGFTRPGVIYTGAWFWAGRGYLGNPKAPWGWPLWDSRYTAPVGLPLAAGAADAQIDWTPGYGGWQSSLLMQFTDAASVAGIGTRVDGDAFRGSVADLRAALGLLPETSTTGDAMPIYTLGGMRTGEVAAGTPYYTNPGDAAPRAKIGATARYLLTAYDATGKWAALDGGYAGPAGTAPVLCGWVPLSAVTDLQPLTRPYHVDLEVTSSAAPVVTVTQA